MKKIKIGITGMTCGGCIISVNKAIKKVEGVKEVKVSLKDNTAVISLSESANIDEIKNNLTTAGYKPKEYVELLKENAEACC